MSEVKRHYRKDGRKTNQNKAYEGQLVPTEDQLRENVISQFCARIYEGQSVQEAASNCGFPASIFIANKLVDENIGQALRFAEKRDLAPKSLDNPSAGMMRGPLEMKAMLAHRLMADGLFEKYLEWFRRVDPNGDPEVFDEKMMFLIKNRFIDQILPRTSSSEDRVTTENNDQSSKSMDELKAEVAAQEAKWKEQQIEIEAAKEHQVELARRLEEQRGSE